MPNVSLGAVGETTGPLRPCGIVVIKGRRFDATTEGTFVEPKTRVVVVGRKQNTLIVREIDTAPVDSGPTQQPVPFRQHGQLDENVVQPLTRLETFPAKSVFAAAGLAGGFCLAISGQVPWTWELGALPVAGLLAGSIFNYAVSVPRQLAAPFADHRRHTGVFGVAMSAMMVIGFLAGFGFFGGPLAGSIGWFAGALIGLAMLFLLSIS